MSRHVLCVDMAPSQNTHKTDVKTLADRPSQQKFAGLYGIRCELVKDVGI